MIFINYKSLIIVNIVGKALSFERGGPAFVKMTILVLIHNQKNGIISL